MPEVAGPDACAELEKRVADLEANIARDNAAVDDLLRQFMPLKDELDGIDLADKLGQHEFGSHTWSDDDVERPVPPPVHDLKRRLEPLEQQLRAAESALHSHELDLEIAKNLLAQCRAPRPTEPNDHIMIGEPGFIEPEVQIMIGAPPPIFKPETIVIDMAPTSAAAATSAVVEPPATKPAGLSDQQKRVAAGLGALVLLLLLGGGGYALTRGASTPSQTLVVNASPTRAAAAVAPAVIVSGNASVKVVANGDTTVAFQWTANGAKPGDIATVALRGPGVPATVDIPVGADGKFSQTFEVGKFGSCSWGATVTSIGGRAVQSFFPAEVGVCITTNIMRLDPNRVACNGSTMHLEWKVILAPPNAPIEIALTGPGLPPTLSLVLGPDGVAMQDLTFPRVSGTATMTAKVVSIGSSTGPWLNSTSSAHFDCLP